jgi:hypothetical protein
VRVCVPQCERDVVCMWRDLLSECRSSKDETRTEADEDLVRRLTW